MLRRHAAAGTSVCRPTCAGTGTGCCELVSRAWFGGGGGPCRQPRLATPRARRPPAPCRLAGSLTGRLPASPWVQTCGSLWRARGSWLGTLACPAWPRLPSTRMPPSGLVGGWGRETDGYRAARLLRPAPTPLAAAHTVSQRHAAPRAPHPPSQATPYPTVWLSRAPLAQRPLPGCPASHRSRLPSVLLPGGIPRSQGRPRQAGRMAAAAAARPAAVQHARGAVRAGAGRRCSG